MDDPSLGGQEGQPSSSARPSPTLGEPAWSPGSRRNTRTALPFKRGIAVACGNGLIELDLVKRGIVERFECFDFAEQRIAVGRTRAEQAGLGDRVHYHASDAFAEVTGEGEYDFVHWRNAIHHMLDTREAIAWSARCLAPGGVLYLDDYVGPSRFQYPKAQLTVFSEVPRRATPPLPGAPGSAGGVHPAHLCARRSRRT